MTCTIQFLCALMINRMQDAGVRQIVEGPSGSKLRELNLTNCVRVSDVTLLRIAQRYEGCFAVLWYYVVLGYITSNYTVIPILVSRLKLVVCIDINLWLYCMAYM